MTLVGVVLLPDGTPVEGAVVVSNAGGRAITEVVGAYRLALEVPREARDVQVTAVADGGTGRLASTRVELRARSAAQVEPLVLALDASCSPRWLPTFSGQPGTDSSVQALAVFDDGGGPALYVGGGFFTAGGMTVNGSSWGALGTGFAVAISDLAVLDDGSGHALSGRWRASMTAEGRRSTRAATSSRRVERP